MFGIDIAVHDCWNGFPSSNKKGASKLKSNYKSRSNKTKNNNQGTFIESLGQIDKKYWLYLGLVSFLLTILAYKWLSVKLKN